MVCVECDAQRHMFHDAQPQRLFLADVGAVPGEDDVVFPVEQPRGQHVSIAAVAKEQDVGVFLMETAQILGEVTVLITLGIAKAQFALQAGGCFVDARKRHIHASEDFPRLLEEDLSRRRQGDGAAVAVKQLCPDMRLERMDLLGDCRLRDILLHGCLGEASMLRDGYKIAQLIEVQGESTCLSHKFILL